MAAERKPFTPTNAQHIGYRPDHWQEPMVPAPAPLMTCSYCGARNWAPLCGACRQAVAQLVPEEATALQRLSLTQAVKDMHRRCN